MVGLFKITPTFKYIIVLMIIVLLGWFIIGMSLYKYILVIGISSWQDVAAVSNVLLLVAAIYGLKQIAVARNTLKINSKRDACKIAADQCNLTFKGIILPLYKKLVAEIRKNKVTFLRSGILKFRGRKLLAELKKERKSERLILII